MILTNLLYLTGIYQNRCILNIGREQNRYLFQIESLGKSHPDHNYSEHEVVEYDSNPFY